MASTFTGSEPMTRLVADVDQAVRRHGSPELTVHAVSDALAPYLGRPDLIGGAQCEGDPQGYRQHLLHVAPDGAFSVVALVWLPGQATRVHDHICWCVVGVHEAEEHETRYRLVEDRLVETTRLVNPRGSVSGVVPPGDIHLVRNGGDSRAISLHVYGADISVRGTSIRRCYDLPVEQH
jgi:3-mercaptopropionate dioxygenase